MTTAHRRSELPRWSIADVHESLDCTIVRRCDGTLDAPMSNGSSPCSTNSTSGRSLPDPSPPTTVRPPTGCCANYNRVAADLDIVHATCTPRCPPTLATSRRRRLMSELEPAEAALRPLLARLADWVAARWAPNRSPRVSDEAARAPRAAQPPRRARRTPDDRDRGASLRRALLDRFVAWGRLQRDVTSQLSAEVALPDGSSDAADAGRPRPGHRSRRRRPPGRLRRRDGGVADRSKCRSPRR